MDGGPGTLDKQDTVTLKAFEMYRKIKSVDIVRN